MQRDIKFRAWIKADKRMEMCISVNPFHVSDCDRLHWKHEEVELMQYTDLKDKNGKEIYEGDILSCGDGKVPTQILWVDDYGGWGAKNLKRNEIHAMDKYFKRYISEIIGNIYDNPELLQEVE